MIVNYLDKYILYTQLKSRINKLSIIQKSTFNSNTCLLSGLTFMQYLSCFGSSGRTNTAPPKVQSFIQLALQYSVLTPDNKIVAVQLASLYSVLTHDNKVVAVQLAPQYSVLTHDNKVVAVQLAPQYIVLTHDYKVVAVQSAPQYIVLTHDNKVVAVYVVGSLVHCSYTRL